MVVGKALLLQKILQDNESALVHELLSQLVVFQQEHEAVSHGSHADKRALRFLAVKNVVQEKLRLFGDKLEVAGLNQKCEGVGGCVAHLVLVFFPGFSVLDKEALEDTNSVQMVAFYCSFLHRYELSDPRAFILENSVYQQQCELQHFCVRLSFFYDFEENAQKLLKILFFVEEFPLVIIRKVEEALELQ